VHRERASPRLDEIRACPNDREAVTLTAAGPLDVKRLRPTGRDARRSTGGNRDLLHETDEYLRGDAQFPPLRGKRDSAVLWDIAARAEPATVSESAHSASLVSAPSVLVER